jgi:hypothetical protein
MPLFNEWNVLNGWNAWNRPVQRPVLNSMKYLLSDTRQIAKLPAISTILDSAPGYCGTVRLFNNAGNATPEDKARENIDRMLTSAGWAVRDLSEANIFAYRGVVGRNFSLKAATEVVEQLNKSLERDKVMKLSSAKSL